MAGMTRGMLKSAGKDGRPEEIAKEIESFMDRQGHVERPKS
jgi:hypothetical protein